MTIDVPAPLMKLRFCDDAGEALVGGKLFTYAAGTTTKLATYTDSTGGTSNVNPIILDSRGECNVWLPPGTAYKFTLAPSTDSDPPTNAFWTVDQVTGGLAQVPFGTDTGAANAYVVTGVAGITALTAGTSIVVKFAHTNTGASTLNVNGLGVRNITDQTLAALVSGAIRTNQCSLLVYDGTEWQIQFQSFNILADPGIPSTRITEPSSCYSILVAQGTTTHNSNVVEVGGNFGMTANTGSGTGHENVTLYAGTLVQAGAGDSYSLEASLTIASGATAFYQLNAFASQILFSNNDRDLPVSGANGTGTGLRISGTPAAGCIGTYGLLFLSGTVGTALFHNGIHFPPGSIADLAIAEASNATRGIGLYGGAAQAYKIDCAPGVASHATSAWDMRLANAKGIVGSKADGSGDLNVIALDSSNQVVVGSASVPALLLETAGDIVPMGDIAPAVNNALNCGAVGDQWAIIAATAVWYGTLNAISDRRKKKDIGKLSGLAAMEGLSAKTYSWRKGQGSAGRQAGFIAQEVRAWAKKRGLDSATRAEDGTEGYKPDHLLAVLWNGLLEETAARRALEQRLAAVEQRLANGGH